MKEKIHVHVADDHKILIEGIIAVINTDKDIKIKGYSLTGQEVIDWFSKKRNTSLPVMICDYTSIRTAARANPVIYLLNKGTVDDKWSYNDFDDACKS